MKCQNLLLFALFTIFVLQAQANGDAEDYKQWKHDFAKTFKELFKTNHCNKCQSLMWDHFKNPGQCATAFNLGCDIYEVIKDSDKGPKPYDLTFFKKGLNKYYHEDFHCSQQKDEKIYNKIQNVCKHELSVKFDRCDDPKNFKDITAYAAYGILLIFTLEFLAEKLFVYEFVEKLIKWMKKKTNADPKAIISHDLKFVIKGDGKKIRIPRSFVCDPCWRKMANIYVDCMKEYNLKKSVKKNIWGSHQVLEVLYLPHCTHHKRGLVEILKARDSKLNEHSANPAFSV
ncbi:hypothetical protein RclHR1_08380001 [Rhizophagus clarus]|uniref:Saposin B-type domain-containing protein n=1 Tax=Rhizophagus clarus TaxID=94130 RepID=A0A2Z6SF16_9GLOM|nr:hypothetical protein RclHR1_08380001 [Rhizophagus clarus]